MYRYIRKKTIIKIIFALHLIKVHIGTSPENLTPGIIAPFFKPLQPWKLQVIQTTDLIDYDRQSLFYTSRPVPSPRRRRHNNAFEGRSKSVWTPRASISQGLAHYVNIVNKLSPSLQDVRRTHDARPPSAIQNISTGTYTISIYRSIIYF